MIKGHMKQLKVRDELLEEQEKLLVEERERESNDELKKLLALEKGKIEKLYHELVSHISHMSYHEFDASYVLMRNKFGKVVTLYIGLHHKSIDLFTYEPKQGLEF
jgi:hypothetical protein